MDCSPPGSSVHGDSPGKNTGVGCHALLQGIFPTQGSNPGFPHCRQLLYCLSYQGSLDNRRKFSLRWLCLEEWQIKKYIWKTEHMKRCSGRWERKWVYGESKPYFRGREEPVKIFEKESNMIRLEFQSHPVDDMERKLLCESRQLSDFLTIFFDPRERVLCNIYFAEAIKPHQNESCTIVL